MRTKRPDRKVPISIKLPAALLNRIEDFIARASPTVRDRTHLIELSVVAYMRKPPK